MNKHKAKAHPDLWLQSYGDIMYQFALTRVNDAMVAEDLVQETFLSALKGLDGFKGDASEKNWLFAILKNKIIDHFRKLATRGEYTDMSGVLETGNEWFDVEGNWVRDNMPGDLHVREDELERKEFRKMIDWCKSNLKKIQQTVFTLKYLEDMSSDEICKVLDISPSNYWVLMHRARLQMRDCIEKRWIKNGMP